MMRIFHQILFPFQVTSIHTNLRLKMNESLKKVWAKINKEFNVSEERAESWWKTISDRYSEPQRHYHTISHIDDMFRQFKVCKACVTDENSLALAMIFHDVIYEPKLGNNEEESANLFKEYTSDCWGVIHDEKRDKIAEWILATKTHTTPQHSDKDHFAEDDIHYLLDIDLSVLGRESEGYQEYADQIRQEYIHVPEDVFRQKRPEVLETFLQRPKIFCTKIFSEMYEQKARDNIAEEIRKLRCRQD